MVNCGACGRFMNKAEGVVCSNCPLAFHTACFGKAKAAAKLPNWLCPECSKNKPRDNRPDTPAKGSLNIDSGELDLIDAPQNLPNQFHNLPDNSVVDVGATNLVVELRLLREQLSGVQKNIEMLRQDFQDLRNTLAGHTSRISSLEGKVDALESEFTAKHHTAEHLESIIDKLRLDLKEKDQDLLSNDIEISNVPENSGENPEHLVLLIAAKLGVHLDERDIVLAERVGPRQPRGEVISAPENRVRSRPIVARLTRRALRDQLLRNMRVRRGADTADFGLTTESRPFYVNERLTKYNRVLLHKAREARARMQWRFVWTRRGRIFVKQDEDMPTYLIRTENDLSRVFGNVPV